MKLPNHIVSIRLHDDVEIPGCKYDGARIIKQVSCSKYRVASIRFEV